MEKNKTEQLYKEQDGKCFFCGRAFPLSHLTYDHLIPKSFGVDAIQNTIVLSCPECNNKRGNRMPFNEYEFASFISGLLENHKDFRNVNKESLISQNLKYRADIVCERKHNDNWTSLVLELKSFPTFTSKRISEILFQLNTYKQHLAKDIKIVLVFPGVLPENNYLAFQTNGIEVWDSAFISNFFKEQIENIDNKLFQKYFLHNISNKSKIWVKHIDRLSQISPGKLDWPKYQKQIEEILIYLFEDTLSAPITELPDKYGVNRRDFILRNYQEQGFWKYLREQYCADFIVIDAKNYSGKIKKNQVLQIANYLKKYGSGLFAIIISRNGEEDKGSYFTRKEKWVSENKMIIILDDNDMEKMILSKAASNAPEEIIKQKIEDFRLEI